MGGTVRNAHADTQVSVGCSLPDLLFVENNTDYSSPVTFSLAPGCVYLLLRNTLEFAGDVTIIGNGATLEGSSMTVFGSAVVNDGTLRIINLTPPATGGTARAGHGRRSTPAASAIRSAGCRAPATSRG